MKPKERFPLKNHVVFKELSRPFSLTPRASDLLWFVTTQMPSCVFWHHPCLLLQKPRYLCMLVPHPTSTPRISAEMLASHISVTFLATILWQGTALQSISCPCTLLPLCLETVNSVPSRSYQAVNSQIPDLASTFKQLLLSCTYSSHSFDSVLAKCVFSKFTGRALL